MDFGQWIYDIIVDPITNIFRGRTWRWRILHILDNALPTVFIWFPIAAATLAAAGWTAAGSAISSALAIIASSPVIFPVLSTLGTWITATAFPAVASFLTVNIPWLGIGPALGSAVSALGLVTNPIGWGVLGILALPAVAGGFYEAWSRIINAGGGRDNSFLKKAFSVMMAVALSPLNFAYGFCRTAFHMATGRGYLGCVKTTVQGVNTDLIRESAAADAGGGSWLRGAVPSVVDRLAVGPVLGVVSGFTASLYKAFNFVMEHVWDSDSIPKILKPLAFIAGLGIGTAITMPFNIGMGIWRGIRSGSQAAIDTFQYWGTGQSEHSARSLNDRLEIDEKVTTKTISSHAHTLKDLDLSMNQGTISDTSRYKVANLFAKEVLAYHKAQAADPENKEKLDNDLARARIKVKDAVRTSPRREEAKAPNPEGVEMAPRENNNHSGRRR